MKKKIAIFLSVATIMGVSAVTASAAATCGDWSKYGQATTYCGTPICYDNSSKQVHTTQKYRRTCWYTTGNDYYEYKTVYTDGSCC